MQISASTRAHSIHAGTELFVGTFFKEYRDYQAASFPESANWRRRFQRVDVFVAMSYT
jgi:hypothetical protein